MYDNVYTLCIANFYVVVVFLMFILCSYVFRNKSTAVFVLKFLLKSSFVFMPNSQYLHYTVQVYDTSKQCIGYCTLQFFAR